MKRWHYFIGIFFLWQACAPEDVFIDVSPAPSQIAVSSQMLGDNVLLVTLSRSFSALNPNTLEDLEEDFIGELLVDSAFVTVNSQGFLDTLFEIGPGLFVGELSQATEGADYHLNVFDSTTSVTIRASTQLQQQIALDTAFLECIIEGEDTTYIAHYQFQDPPEENWFITQATSFSGLSFEELFNAEIVGDSIVFENDSVPDLFTGEDNATLLYTRLLADITFRDSAVRNTVTLPEQPGDTILFSLTHVSEGYFRYLDAQQRNGGVLASIGSEPINFPSNVENGLGYFAMNQPSFLVFIKED
ncbi:MAG: DUF4249 family protein [Cytophagales bacterium]|nr:DUF4249 family protein [Cytophagales bacterium]